MPPFASLVPSVTAAILATAAETGTIWATPRPWRSTPLMVCSH
jgi:hypothetical protein